MNMKQSCKALICAIEGELDGRHCTEEQAAAILDHAVPSLTEALARVEAERQEWTLLTMDTMIQRDTAKAQLAEAVGLLDQLTSTGCWDVSNSDLVDRARDIWMEHRDAKLSNAKGAQAEPANFGQELEAFEKWRHTQADSLRRCGYPDGADAFIRLGSVQWAGWQARAALATQPAAGDPVAWARQCDLDESDPAIFVAREEVLESGYDIPLYAAPPAAAHGDSASEQHRNNMADTIVSLRTEIAALRRNAAAHEGEAVRKDAERYRALRNTPEIFIGVAEGDDMVFLKSPDQLDQLADNAAAMRAQAGEGGE